MEEKLITLRSGRLQITASATGAELHSVQLDGHEYLWTGDPKFWRRHSPVLFPFVGRLYDGRYTVHGKEYSMKIHGFSQEAQFEVVKREEAEVVFELRDSEETLAVYPYHFAFRVGYRLSGTTVEVTYSADNLSDETMHFGLGAHPGFLVPMEEGLSFEDYVLEFPDACRPDQVVWSDQVLSTGRTEPYELEDGKRLPLSHNLFTFDAIVLEHSGESVCIRSDKGSRSVTVTYPQMPYVGFWHRPNCPAPYLCVEPWVSLPAREGVVEEFAARRDLVHLPAGESYRNVWSITLE